ncbi:ABC transporter ATP-binding protein [Aestuariispira insulae]|uniref:Phospholipid/cholesterol/gamma-HCH transport system ATP-binding protein n=1 Tax=Aestuariispira insulae TaxID=1461337 RepID=A0A3D9HVS6_9PROT|nr:ATP-binding cassette domain-containing protein [Aestuariispira insulae]RED53567.1 phospholipid/cholesterol/gamma-HCH transport system ATP-binding protein [Aestuariispira insulae]
MTRTATAPVQASPKIAMRNVKKAFGSKVVLDGFDLDVMPGESVVIIGGSGTGKSVSLKCILGLLNPDSGEIDIDGQPILGLSKQDRDAVNAKIGMLFQNAALFDSISVWENVAFTLVQGEGMARSKARDIAMEKLGQVGLSAEIGERNPAQLSGGMRKRVGLARAIAGDPDIIFFDEPTTGLDPIMGHIIDKLIVKCVREVGATALTITHDMASARRIADRVTMLYKGKNIWTDRIEKLDSSGNPYVHQFVNGLAEGPIDLPILKN